MPVFAADPVVTDTPTPSSTPTEMSQASSANSTIESIKGFIGNLDSFAGGFVFSTPEDLFSNTVHLKDGTAITNLSLFRNAFAALSVAMVAFLIFSVGGSNMISGKIAFIRPFLGRIIVYCLLVLLVPLLGTQSIKIGNALTTALTTAPVLPKAETSLTTFSNDFYTKADQQIASGKSTPESLAVPSAGWSSFLQSAGHFVVLVVLALASVIALIFGILFILTQFALRFLSLLFLSLVYPLVLPFVITEKTQGIFNNFLKIWFTLIIHQPAFALGYMMVMMIVRSVLDAQGANLGLLFLYITSLFFLGTVNVLAARIFADVWVAAGLNFEAAVAARGMVAGFLGGKQLAQKGVQYGKAGVQGVKKVGKSIADSFGSPPKRVPNLAWERPVVDAQYGGDMLNPGIKGGVDTIYGNPPEGYVPSTLKQQGSVQAMPPSASPFSNYARDFSNNGFTVEQGDKMKGTYTLSGKGYSYYDEKNDLTHTFPSKRDALASGYKENQIREVSLSKRQVVDISQFSGRNPYNAAATKKAMQQGHDSKYAHVTKRSDPVRVKHNLEMNQGTLSKQGIQGYMVNHYDNPTGARSKRATTRIISLGKIGEQA